MSVIFSKLLKLQDGLHCNIVTHCLWRVHK